MASKEFRSPAHLEPPRTRLTSPWTLLGIALTIGVTLVLIFPGRGVVTHTTAQKQPDAVSLTYLENLVRKEPSNYELRFTLAQKQTEIGKIAEARAALEPLYNSPDPAVRQRARLMDFKLQLQQMQAMPAGSVERERETERLRQELVAMTQYEWNVAGLLDLANLAGQVGARKMRADIYLRIARSDHPVARQWIDEAARTVLADSEYATAAEIYFAAKERAKSREDERYYFLSALKAYQAGNMMKEAMAAADRHVGALANDDETLRYLIRLARMSNDLPRAQTYAKRLMRMSQPGVLMRWLQALADRAIPSAHAADTEARTPGKVMLGMRPYNREDYQLAYEVFLANRNLEDAYRVAAAAIQQVPNDLGWRERLAQVGEWSNRPSEALEQWLYLARRTGRAAAWQAVLRIAPGLFDDEALLEAMRYQVATGAQLTDEQWRAVVDAYERVGRPREGVAFLEREYAKRPRPILLEQQAFLMERMGDLDGAIAAYRRLIERSGPTTQRVANLATLLIIRGDFKAAYAVLEAHRSKVAPEDAEYWRLLADLALQLQDEVSAERALDTLVASGKATPDDFSRLIALLNVRNPEAAARLAEMAFARFRTPDFLATALSIHSARRDFVALRRIFSTLSPEMHRMVAGDPDLLIVRADYFAATGHPELALADYRAALTLDPNHRFARLGLMWFLIDRRDLAQLRREVAFVTTRLTDDPLFDGALGAAWLTLGEPARGLPYFQRMVKRDPDDYLWLLNYADALDQNLQADMAWRVRRHAWMKVRQEMAKAKGGERVPIELLQAQARIATQFTPGDETFAVIRNLLRQDQSLDAASTDPTRRGIDSGTREIALSWLLSNEQYIGAKAWLWKQYGRRLAQPPWAEANVAIAHNDLETLQRMLEEKADIMPRYDRHEAARSTQQHRLAQDIAFTELEKMPQDDEMHLRLTDSTLTTASSVEVGQTHFRRDVVSGRERTGEIAVWLSPRLRLSFEVSHIEQGLKSAGLLASVPAADTLFGVTALFRHRIGETRISVFHRDALGDVTGFRLSHERPLGPRINGRIGLAYNERATETSPLTVGAVRDNYFVEVEYTFSKREYVLGQLFHNRYHTQDRTFIGSGEGLNWELGHRFRTEYPDFHVRLAGSVNSFNHSGSGDAGTVVLNPDGTVPTSEFFLPPSFAVYGVHTGFGTFYQTNYTRALRPFVDVGVTHNTVTGNGYSALLGMSGSVIGADRLTLYFSTGKGGTGTNQLSREVGLRYMYLFDRF